MGGRTGRERRRRSSAGDGPAEGGGREDSLRQRAMQARLRERRAQAGTPVAEKVRKQVEAATEVDLSAVRVHTDEAAAQSAQSAGAQAFTVGSNVHFAAGQYRPGSADGDRLIAHELAHTAQQMRAGTSMQMKSSTVSDPADAAEKEADAIADAALAGRRAAPTQTPAPLARKEDDDGPVNDQPPRDVITEFGRFQVIPDGRPPAGPNQLTESELADAERLLAEIKSGGNSINVDEKDNQGVEHPGFKDLVHERFVSLLSLPTGRALLLKIAADGKQVTIKPSANQFFAGTSSRVDNDDAAHPDMAGNPGDGSTTTIFIDPSMQDDDNKVRGPDGELESEPCFLALGHELIHALHSAEGQNMDKSAGSDPEDFDNEEEEETIEGTGISEDQLRAEYGLPPRLNHKGRDWRFPKDDEPK
jgi:Domain of unknown function (DUF4157)/Effector protein